MRYVFRSLRPIQTRISRARRVYVLLDYDGTLTQIVSNPDGALLQESTRQLLKDLVSRRRCIVSIVSGRRVDQLSELVRVKGAYYVGNHGYEIEGPRLHFVHPKAKQLSHELQLISAQIRAQTGEFGALVEDKILTNSVHYRGVPSRNVRRLLHIIMSIVHERREFKLAYDKKVVEIRPRVDWDKGRAVQLVMKTIGRGLPIYIGDDHTDEDAFVRIRSGITILVSRHGRHSHAKYYIKDVDDVHRFLRVLTVFLGKKYSTPHGWPLLAVRP